MKIALPVWAKWQESDPSLSFIKAATRPILFDTRLEEYPLASYGGTITLVRFEGRIFGITCRHAFGDFRWQDLLLMNSRRGGECIRPRTMHGMTQAVDHAIDSSLLDIAIISFEDVEHSWFVEQPLVMSAETVADCSAADELYTYGYLAEFCDFSNERLQLLAVDLKPVAQPPNSHDVVLRTAIFQAVTPVSVSLSGPSGSPVIRLLDKKVCGLVTRGRVVEDGTTFIHFVEASDILELLKAASRSSAFHHYYKKRNDN